MLFLCQDRSGIHHWNTWNVFPYSLPSEKFGIGFVELAFLAYYSSTDNVLWIEAQLTDASYLFDKNCRLTGGFAMICWFSRGDFLLSLGGYHPKFNPPSHYPAVPRLGFNWKPVSGLTIKGGAYLHSVVLP